MSNLKTLKDFDKITVKSYRGLSEDWYNGFDAGIHSMGSNLKQEAIKWIKTLYSDNYSISIIDGVDRGEWAHCLKTFFNITDEDLK